MIEQPRHDPRLIPVLIAVGYLAALIALWGMLSLVLDVDAIQEPDAGPLLGPAMAISAGGVVALALWGLRRRGHAALTAIGAAAVAYLAMLIVGGVGYAFTRGAMAEVLLFGARHALSPFVTGAALLAGLAVVLLWVATASDRRAVRARRDAASGDHLTTP